MRKKKKERIKKIRKNIMLNEVKCLERFIKQLDKEIEEVKNIEKKREIN